MRLIKKYLKLNVWIILSAFAYSFGFFWYFLTFSVCLYGYRQFKVIKKLGNVKVMTGYEFEDYLVSVFRKLKYKVKRTKLSSDQGGDLILLKNGRKTVVQAKRYSRPVGNKAVQEVLAAKHYYKCDKAWVVSNSTYTKSAKDLASKVGVKLFDEKMLRELI